MSGTPITHEQSEKLFNELGLLDLTKTPPKHTPQAWKDNEVKALAEVVHLCGRHWALVSVEMAKRNFTRTPMQCCSKYRAMEEAALKALQPESQAKRGRTG